MRNFVVGPVSNQKAKSSSVDTLLFDAGESGADVFVENRFCKVVIGQQHSGIVSRSVSDRLVRRQRRVQRSAAELLQRVPNHRHPRRTADGQDNVNVSPAHLVVFKHGLGEIARPRHHRLRQRFKLCLLDLVRLAMAAVLASQRRLWPYGQTAFRVLNFQSQELQTLRIATRVDFELFDKLLGDGIEQRAVPVDAAEIQIAAAGNDFDFVLLILHQRQVERPATEVVHHDPLLFGQLGEPQPFGAEYVTQRGRNRFVDHVDFRQARSLASFDHPLTLNVAELGRHCDDCLLDLANLFLSGGQQLLQHERRDVDRRVSTIVHHPLAFEVAHVPLRILNDAQWLHDGVAKRFRSDDHFAAFVKQDDRWRGQFAFLVGQRDGLAMLVQIRDARVRRSKVDSDSVSLKHLSQSFMAAARAVINASVSEFPAVRRSKFSISVADRTSALLRRNAEPTMAETSKLLTSQQLPPNVRPSYQRL